MPSVKEKAIALLARREHSQLELRKKLQLRGFAENEIQSTLEWVKNKGYQDEARFCDSYIRQRISAGFGPVRIQKELVERGVSKHLLEASEPWQSADWQGQIERLVQRRFDTPCQSRHEYQKRARFLMGRGFTIDQIIQVLK